MLPRCRKPVGLGAKRVLTAVTMKEGRTTVTILKRTPRERSAPRPTDRSFGDFAVMVATFATLLAALVASRLERTRLAAWLIVSTFALAVGLFLYEIYSPDYGFRMPWIQTELERSGEPDASRG